MIGYYKNFNTGLNGSLYDKDRYDLLSDTSVYCSTGAQPMDTLDGASRYYYGTPGQEELDALFGTEACRHLHYCKSIVRDANGQFSVSYPDMYGLHHHRHFI